MKVDLLCSWSPPWINAMIFFNFCPLLLNVLGKLLCMTSIYTRTWEYIMIHKIICTYYIWCGKCLCNHVCHVARGNICHQFPYGGFVCFVHKNVRTDHAHRMVTIGQQIAWSHTNHAVVCEVRGCGCWCAYFLYGLFELTYMFGQCFLRVFGL